VKVVAALFGLAALGFALAAGAQTEDWGDSNEAWASSGEYEASKALCRELRHREPPEADRPTPAQARALQGCDSEALYYGIGRPADPEKARQCAFLETERDSDGAFSGRAMLMTIYANGVGTRRDLDVAIHLACGVDGAPAESHGRVSHLAELRDSHWSGSDFGYCDDITSGLAMGYCAGHEARIAGDRRDTRLAEIAARWSPRERRMLVPLRQALDAYATAHGEGEIDLTGTARGAMAINAEEALHDEFLAMIERLDSGRAPRLSSERFRAADAALNAAYREAVRGPFYDSPGSVTREGIRDAQRAWLRYRDAFLAFAALRYPQVRRDSLAAWLTEQRIVLLRQESE